jgi:hypothetical protein
MMDWMPILSKVVEAILIATLPPLAVALVSFVIGLAKKAWLEFKLANPLISEWVETAAEFAVKAAEQAGAAELISDKKAYAMQIAETWLIAHNITVDLDLIDAAIEKAVLELFHTDEPVG